MNFQKNPPGSEHPQDADVSGTQPIRRRGAYYATPAEYGGTYYGGQEASGDDLLGEINIRRLVRVIRRKWITILVSLAFFLTLGVLYLFTATKIYEAKTLIELSIRRPRIAGNQDAVIEEARGMRSDEVFNTHLERFKGEAMLNLAVEEILSATNLVEVLSADEVKRWLRASRDFKLVRRSQLLTISFQDASPDLAMLGADAFARAAEQLAYSENRRVSEKAVLWLKEQAQTAKSALERADQSLLEYRAKNNIDVLETQRRTLAEGMMAYNQTLVQLESDLALSKDLYDLLKEVELQPEKSGQLPVTTPRLDEIRAAMNSWISAQTAMDSMLTRYTEKHPKVRAQVQESLALRQQVVRAIERSREAAMSNMELLKRQVASIQAIVDRERATASALELQIVTIQTQLAALEREREAADISYKGLLNRMEEARLSADETTATVKVVEWATLPKNPIKPRKLVILAVMLMLGLGFGCGLALFVDSLEDHITSSTDIEVSLGLKVVGMVPRVYGVQNRGDLAQLSHKDKFSQVAEAFAGIRAILDSAQYGEMSKSVLVASTMPEEGKTITSSNLAIASAKSGKKTLLVDLDLRRPRVGKIWKMPDTTPGLIQILSERDPGRFSSLPFATECENLDVVGSRVMTNVSPAELLGGQCVKDFMAWAKLNYDRVVIDSPPYGIVSDAAIFAGATGCVILVCRPGRSRRRAMRLAIQHFRDIGANLIGSVVNDVDFRKDAYFSNYDHHYGYGYGYSYRSEETE